MDATPNRPNVSDPSTKPLREELFEVNALSTQQTNDPMLPVALFASARFSVTAIVRFALNVSFFGQLFVLSFYFQRSPGFEP